MGQFHCRVADAEGRVFSHVEPANSQEEARQKLVDRGLYVYSVESRGGRLAGLVRQKSGRQIGGSEFLILNQQFNTLIKAGLPILKSLDPLPNFALSSPRSGTGSGRASRFPRLSLKPVYFRKFTRRPSWRAKRAEICRVSWTTTLPISE